MLQNVSLAFPVFGDYARDFQLAIGDRQLVSSLAEIRELRRRCGQQMISRQTRNTSSLQTPSKIEDVQRH